MTSPKLTIKKLEDGSFIVKVIDADLDKLNPIEMVNELKDYIEAREEVVIKSNLKFYFDQDLVNDIALRLAQLLAYYSRWLRC